MTFALLVTALALIFLAAYIQVRRINQRADNYSAVEAERLARELTAPLGNAERIL